LAFPSTASLDNAHPYQTVIYLFHVSVHKVTNSFQSNLHFNGHYASVPALATFLHLFWKRISDNNWRRF